MQFRSSLAAIVCLVSLAVVGPAYSGIVGPAGDYNVFVFGDFTSIGGHTEGNMAAGGNFIAPNGYSAATSIQGSAGARIVAGGNVNIGGSGSLGYNGSGTIYASSANLSPNFTVNGGVVSPQNQVDFPSAQTYYQNLSTSWSSITKNGDPKIEGNQWYTKLTLEGDDPSLNVFLITSDLLKDVVDLIIDAPTDSTVLINVSGTKQTFTGGQVTLQGGIDSSHIIYNFFEATELDLISGKNLMGSVLAPNAAVTGNWGALDGQLIAGSFDGTTEFHSVPFTGTVPLPAAIWLFAPAFGFLSVLSRRRKQSS